MNPFAATTGNRCSWLTERFYVGVHQATRETPAEDGGWVLELEMVERDFRRFLKRENLPLEILETPQADEPAVSAI